MGLGVGAENLRTFFGDGQTLVRDAPSFSTVIMDCCAVGRKMSSSRQASPSLIARQMANMALGRLRRGERRTLVVFCFDSSSNHHPMRDVCSQKRYHPPTPAVLARNQAKIESGEMVLVGGRLFKTVDSPYTNGEIASLATTDDVSWNKLFNSAFGKKRAWMLLEQAIEDYISSIGGTLHDGTSIFDVHFVIDGSNGNTSRFYTKGKWKNKPSLSAYGEADLKLEVWSERAIDNEGGLLLTIDSDSVAIALLNNVNATIELSKVWRSKDGQQYYSSVSAKRAQCSSQFTELVNIGCMNPLYCPFQRIFCIISAGGCDYTSGLLGYGIERERLVHSGTHGFDDTAEPWFYRDGDCFFVNVGAMLTFLGRLKVRKARKTLSVRQFCLETHRTLWTILYWCGCGRANTPAGPPSDLGLDEYWIAEHSEKTDTVENLIETVQVSSEPICIGSI